TAPVEHFSSSSHEGFIFFSSACTRVQMTALTAPPNGRSPSSHAQLIATTHCFTAPDEGRGARHRQRPLGGRRIRDVCRHPLVTATALCGHSPTGETQEICARLLSPVDLSDVFYRP